MQIAENVLSKLPSSMLLPETRHTLTHQIKETNISTNDGDDESASEKRDTEESGTNEDLV
jgi:hypothetical protein